LLIEAVDEDLRKVVQLLQELVDWLRLYWLVPLVDLSEARHEVLLRGKRPGEGCKSYEVY
jgi:hypothetical protein